MVKIVLGVLLIFILIGFFIASVNNLDLTERDDQIEFVQQYGKWVYKSVINVKVIVGFVVNQDWSLDEDKKRG